MHSGISFNAVARATSVKYSFGGQTFSEDFDIDKWTEPTDGRSGTVSLKRKTLPPITVTLKIPADNFDTVRQVYNELADSTPETLFLGAEVSAGKSGFSLGRPLCRFNGKFELIADPGGVVQKVQIGIESRELDSKTQKLKNSEGETLSLSQLKPLLADFKVSVPTEWGPEGTHYIRFGNSVYEVRIVESNGKNARVYLIEDENTFSDRLAEHIEVADVPLELLRVVPKAGRLPGATRAHQGLSPSLVINGLRKNPETKVRIVDLKDLVHDQETFRFNSEILVRRCRIVMRDLAN